MKTRQAKLPAKRCVFIDFPVLPPTVTVHRYNAETFPGSVPTRRVKTGLLHIIC